MPDYEKDITHGYPISMRVSFHDKLVALARARNTSISALVVKAIEAYWFDIPEPYVQPTLPETESELLHDEP